jgi:hypothetical protein
MEPEPASRGFHAFLVCVPVRFEQLSMVEIGIESPMDLLKSMRQFTNALVQLPGLNEVASLHSEGD